jgi:23S rRNA-/tRNA-specific pseudouridylate synthase
VRAQGDGMHGRDASPRIAAADVVARTETDAVILKPAGLSCEAPGRGAQADTLLAQARALLGWPDAQLPHRLDRPTRGFVVVARDRAAVAAHNEAIRQGAWTKHYLARVAPRAGVDPRALVGEHKAFLRREGQVARVVRSGGDPSRLAIVAIAPAPARVGEWHALVRLDTGRYHQIRAMCANLGIPLVGDVPYGGNPGPFWLDHCSLWLPPAGAGPGAAPTRVYIPNDPGREPLDASVADALAAASPRGA